MDLAHQEERAPEVFYRPSGKVALHRFLPLLMAGMAVSVVMAIILLLFLGNWYYYIFTPLIAGAPVYLMLYLAIHVGRCRNVWVGVLAGLLLIGLFYGGYWMMNYGVSLMDDDTVAEMKQMTGSTSPIAYFNYRCRTAIIGDSHSRSGGPDPVGGYFLNSAEFIIFIAVAIAFPYVLVRRVYYEDLKSWATSQSFCLLKGDAPTAFTAIITQDWPVLGKLSRLPATTQNQKTHPVQLKLEFAKDQQETPLYITLTGYGKKAYMKNLQEIAPEVEAFPADNIRQMRISPENARDLAGYIPELPFHRDEGEGDLA